MFYGPYWQNSRARKKSPTFQSWDSMKRRCYIPGNAAWARYGSRGITVCERWRDSFEAFFLDMGPRPAGTTIDRIDNDGNYELGNCRWATRAEQYANKSTNLMVTWRGRTMALIAWAAELNLPYCRLQRRLRDGWEVDEAFTVPYQKGVSRPSLAAQYRENLRRRTRREGATHG